MTSQTTSKGAAGTIYLIAIQVISRGLTFVGNQALLRFVLPGHLGLAVQLEALSISVLYTARESLRVALQRRPQSVTDPKKNDDRSTSSQAAVNAAWLVVLLGFLLGSSVGTLYLYQAGTDLSSASDFELSFKLYCAATILELLSEPCFVVIQQNALFQDRARAETTAAITRCFSSLLTAIVMRRAQRTMSVLPFAVGQMLYGLSLFVVYYWSAGSVSSAGGFSLLPKRLTKASDSALSYFSRPLLALAGAFYGQSIFKWLLTQGDTLVLSIFADLRSQGVFALASNYGGLASRLLFQPVEESSRNVFGSLLASSTSTSTRTIKAHVKAPALLQKRKEALQYLSTTLRIYIIAIAIPCTTLLPQVFPILIQALLGSRSQWNSAETSSLLSAYSYYIPCLAINGVLDAFVTSVATEAELGAQSLMMIGVTMIYLSAAYLAMTIMQLGAVGLVYANILNMLLRIAFSMWFTREWTQENVSELRRKDEPSAFRRFLSSSIPSAACLGTSILVLLTLQMQSQIKAMVAETASGTTRRRLRFGPLDLDLFDLSFLLSAAAVLVATIVATEGQYLYRIVEPLVPISIRNRFLSKPTETKSK